MMQRSAARHTTQRAPVTKPSLASVKLILGLGNPGAAYEHTYHNAGALFAMSLRGDRRKPKDMKRKPLFSAMQVGQWTVATPRVFMNDSGRAARATLADRTVRPEELLVAHDDSDIPLGEFRFAFARGAAGHRGVTSIIAALHTNRFWRLRIGVRHHPGKAGSFVLRSIPLADRTTLYSVFGAAYKKLTENEKP